MPSLRQDNKEKMEGQWFCRSWNWLGADNINTMQTKAPALGWTASSIEVLSMLENI